MNFYFDCEFTGLHKDTTLISIGVVSENGNTFYGVLDDYDKTQVNEWIQENVIENLDNGYISSDINDYSIRGGKELIKKFLLIWLNRISNGEEINFVSDVSHYDFILLIDLLYQNALNIPENICPVCYDINIDIQKYFKISSSEAFNMSREKIINDYNLNEMIPLNNEMKHNSLYDAFVIRAIYYLLHDVS